MKTLKVLYNNDTSFIVDIVNNYDKQFYVELFNRSTSKNPTKMREMQEEYGSKNYPLLIIEDENLFGIGAIWSENKPDWDKEINKFL